ncbi:unnamed protein product [Amoebophrya sp. A25]|nr:unnamed protein product [Amoebophrya sp. A25]|eukprot:GSA25T00020137001.1
MSGKKILLLAKILAVVVSGSPRVVFPGLRQLLPRQQGSLVAAPVATTASTSSRSREVVPLPFLHSGAQPSTSSFSRRLSSGGVRPASTATKAFTSKSVSSSSPTDADRTIMTPSSTTAECSSSELASPVVAFLGLGRMGAPMAANLQRCLTSKNIVFVWNRTPAKAQQHSEEHGTQVLESVGDLAEHLGSTNTKDASRITSTDRASGSLMQQQEQEVESTTSSRDVIVFCCLPTSSEVAQIADQLIFAKAKARKELPSVISKWILVDCSSGSRLETVRIGERLRQSAGIGMVDCPVSGGPAGATAGTLAAMVGGDDIGDIEKVMPLIGSFAKKEKMQHVGPLGSGHAVKSVNNLLNSLHLMAATEGLLALKNAGISADTALRCINASSGRSLQTEQRLPEQILTGKYAYGFALKLMRKDCELAKELVEDMYATEGGGGGKNTGAEEAIAHEVDVEKEIDTSRSSNNMLSAERKGGEGSDSSLLLLAASRVRQTCDHYASKNKGTGSDMEDVDYTFLSKYMEEKLNLDLNANANDNETHKNQLKILCKPQEH